MHYWNYSILFIYRINAQQEEICLLVAMDLTVWGFESDVEFKLTFISKEINDWGTFSLPFQW